MVPEGEDYKDVDMPAEIEGTMPASAEGAEPAPAAAESGVSDTTEFMSMRHSVGKAGLVHDILVSRL